jgi:hypothetical protein
MTPTGTQTSQHQIPSPGTGRPTGDPIAIAAFSLGWRIVESYIALEPEGGELETLANVKAANSSQNIRLGYDRVQARLTTVGSALRAAGLQSTGAIAEGYPALRPAGTNTQEAAKELKALHNNLLAELDAVEPPLGIAYSLGQQLSWACLNTNEAQPRFEETSIKQWQDWLQDLATLMPDHAARAVRASLGSWKDIPATTDQLQKQGKRWRQCLGGEKACRDMLERDDYLRASRALAKHTLKGLARSSLFWVAIVSLLALLGGAVLVALTLQPPAKLFGILVPIAGAFGITGKTIATGARRMADRVEEPVWGAELDYAIAIRITCEPAPRPNRG